MAATDTADDLADTLARVIDAFTWRVDGPRVAALAVLGQQPIADGLRAADVLRTLAEQHKPRRWDNLSDTVVCDTCQRAFPCSVADIVGGWMR